MLWISPLTVVGEKGGEKWGKKGEKAGKKQGKEPAWNSAFHQYDSNGPQFAPLLDPDSSPKKRKTLASYGNVKEGAF